MSVYEQYQSQRALARLNRSRHGADMSLDQAEVRYEAMLDWLVAARVWLPLIAAAALSWAGPFPTTTWLVGVGGVLALIFLGAVVGGVLDLAVGAFHEFIRIKTQNAFFRVGGVSFVIGGACALTPGLVALGVALFVFPAQWRRFGRDVLHNSDFERLMRDAREADTVRPIIE